MIYIVAIIFVMIYVWGVNTLGNSLEETANPHDPRKTKSVKTILFFYAVVFTMVVILINLIYLQSETDKQKSMFNKILHTSQTTILN